VTDTHCRPLAPPFQLPCTSRPLLLPASVGSFCSSTTRRGGINRLLPPIPTLPARPSAGQAQSIRQTWVRMALPVMTHTWGFHGYRAQAAPGRFGSRAIIMCPVPVCCPAVASSSVAAAVGVVLGPSALSLGAWAHMGRAESPHARRPRLPALHVPQHAHTHAHTRRHALQVVGTTRRESESCSTTWRGVHNMRS
jgi:hypothetical protein